MRVFVKQYGYKRSGTCYVAAVLRKNFDVKVLVHDLGGKHGDPVDFSTCRAGPALRRAVLSNEVRIAVATKNPYAALCSYIRAHLSWNKMFRWHFHQDARQAVRDRCEVWNRRNRAWMSRPGCRTMAFRHEDLLQDFQGTMRRAQEVLDLTPGGGGFHNIKRRVNPNEKLSKQRFKKSVYTRWAYLRHLGKTLRKAITDTIDWDFAATLGYFPFGGNPSEIVGPPT